ncbi:MAG: response regulator, partial [Bacteroidetes bacterium]
TLHLIYLNLLQNYTQMGQLAMAQIYADSASLLIDSLDGIQPKVSLHLFRYQLALAKEDYQAALAEYEAYHRWEDSLSGKSVREQTEIMRQQFELERQALSNTVLKQEKDQQALQLQQQRFISGISLGGFMLALGLLVYLYRMHQNRKKLVQALEAQTTELSEAKNKAEQATRTKADFLSVMSHEIRTPLNAVIAIGHLLLDESPRPDQKERLLTLRHSARHLLTLINDILDFSKIEAGKLVLEQTHFNLYTLASQSIESFRPLAQRKGLTIGLQYPSELRQWWQGDPIRIGQILSNLISNAVKFTEKGFVHLQISGEGESLHVAVTDTGVGIEPEAQSKIFEAFSQSGADTARRFGGSGLGLSICRQLLNLMGSQIQLQSTPGQGSTFSFSITLPPGIPQQVQDDIPVGLPNDALILVAEDNEINQMVVSEFLVKWHFRVCTADNGEEVLACLEKKAVDLILMDVHMPVMDGLEATRRIRALPDPRLAQIPIIAFTASAGAEGQ